MQAENDLLTKISFQTPQVYVKGQRPFGIGPFLWREGTGLGGQTIGQDRSNADAGSLQDLELLDEFSFWKYVLKATYWVNYINYYRPLIDPDKHG